MIKFISFPKVILAFGLFVSMIIAGCSSVPSVSSPTPLTPSQTLTSTLTLTITPPRTPLPTLSQEDAIQEIAELMQTNTGCTTPCFWGFSPFMNSFSEAKDFFDKFGGWRNETKKGVQSVYSTEFRFYKKNLDIGISIYGNETNGEFRQIEVEINGLEEPNISNQDWLAFRPDSIMREYGLPSNIQILLPEGPTPSGQELQVLYVIIFIYEEQHFVIEYVSAEHFPVINSKVNICPLLDNELQQTKIWLGKDLPGFEEYVFDLEKITSLEMDDFLNLIRGEPKKACFDVYYE